MSGTLRVTLPALFGRRYISPLLPAFLVLHPQLKLGVNIDDQLLDLVGSGFDLGIRIGVLGDSGLVPPRLRAFVDFLANRLGHGPAWEKSASL